MRKSSAHRKAKKRTGAPHSLNLIRACIGLLIAIGFLVCQGLLVWDWDKSLIGLHSFRQTQTAITVYWFLKEGIQIDYQTPVLGKPWSIPFEFPFYQMLVAVLTRALQFDLDIMGRAVSVFFWELSLVPLLAILRWWITDRLERWAVVLLIWSSTTYLYWSDSFMIESTALFFSLAYIYCLVEAVRRETPDWLALAALLCGVIASLQKVTVFLIAVVPALSFCSQIILRKHRMPDRALLKNLLTIFLALAIPIGVAAVWTHHVDALKSFNPLARHFLTSSSLTHWTFGTWDQRFSLATWERMTAIEITWGLGHGFTFILIVAVILFALALWYGCYRWEILTLLAAYAVGPLVFNNLFYIHEYYNYENDLYLQLALGLAIIGLVESFRLQPAWRLMAGGGMLLAISIYGLGSYFLIWIPAIETIPTSDALRQQMAPLARAGNPQDILLIYGSDWNPAMPYYSGRRAIMDKEARSLDDPALKESLELLSPDQHVAAMVIYDPQPQDPTFVRERVERFHLQPQPIVGSWGTCYLRAP